MEKLYKDLKKMFQGYKKSSSDVVQVHHIRLDDLVKEYPDLDVGRVKTLAIEAGLSVVDSVEDAKSLPQGQMATYIILESSNQVGAKLTETDKSPIKVSHLAEPNEVVWRELVNDGQVEHVISVIPEELRGSDPNRYLQLHVKYPDGNFRWEPHYNLADAKRHSHNIELADKHHIWGREEDALKGAGFLVRRYAMRIDGHLIFGQYFSNEAFKDFQGTIENPKGDFWKIEKLPKDTGGYFSTFTVSKRKNGKEIIFERGFESLKDAIAHYERLSNQVDEGAQAAKEEDVAAGSPEISKKSAIKEFAKPDMDEAKFSISKTRAIGLDNWEITMQLPVSVDFLKATQQDMKISDFLSFGSSDPIEVLAMMANQELEKRTGMSFGRPSISTVDLKNQRAKGGMKTVTMTWEVDSPFTAYALGMDLTQWRSFADVLDAASVEKRLSDAQKAASEALVLRKEIKAGNRPESDWKEFVDLYSKKGMNREILKSEKLESVQSDDDDMDDEHSDNPDHWVVYDEVLDAEEFRGSKEDALNWLEVADVAYSVDEKRQRFILHDKSYLDEAIKEATAFKINLPSREYATLDLAQKLIKKFGDVISVEDDGYVVVHSKIRPDAEIVKKAIESMLGLKLDVQAFSESKEHKTDEYYIKLADEELGSAIRDNTRAEKIEIGKEIDEKGVEAFMQEESKNLTESVEPSVYVGTYGKYNSGSLKGKWMNLSDYSDYEEFIEAARELHKDESDPELMFQDFEGFPEKYYRESSLAPELWDWLALDEDEREILEAFIKIHGESADIDEARDQFIGTYDDMRDLGIYFFDEVGVSEDQMPSYLDMSETDKRLYALEDANIRVDNMSDEEVLEALDKEEDEIEISKAREELEEQYYDDLKEQLDKDAVGYFMDELGYTAEDLVKNNLFSVDYDSYASDLDKSGDIDTVRLNGKLYAFFTR